jgi:hypothetical protein
MLTSDRSWCANILMCMPFCNVPVMLQTTEGFDGSALSWVPQVLASVLNCSVACKCWVPGCFLSERRVFEPILLQFMYGSLE